MITPGALVAEGREWRGTKFRHQQSIKGVYSDCIGFITGTAREQGHPDADRFARDIRFHGYGPTPDPVKIRLAFGDYLDAVPTHLMQLADVLVLKFLKQPMHFAFVSGLSPVYIMHCYEPRGGWCEHELDAKWRSRIVCVGRIRGLA